MSPMSPLAACLVATLPIAVAAGPDDRGERPDPADSLASAPIEAPEPVAWAAEGERLFRAGPIYLAGQPGRATLERLAREGVSVVVNLRPPEEMESVEFDEPGLVESLGMTYVSIPIGPGPYAPRLEAVDRLREALEAHEGKALIHCSLAIRASRLWAAHLVRDRGVAREQADAYTRITTDGPARVEQYLGDEPESR